MNSIEIFTRRFEDGIHYFRAISGKDPTVCVMGYDDFEAFSELATNNCQIVMKDNDPEFGKRQWLGVDIFEGNVAIGMYFGA